MDAKQSELNMSLEDRINGVFHDSFDILSRLSQIEHKEGQPIEIVSELPAAADPDIIIAAVQRWRAIQQYFDCDVRVYAWSYTPASEKYVLGCVQNMEHLCVTTLPTYLRHVQSIL